MAAAAIGGIVGMSAVPIPVWEQHLSIPFDVVGDMHELVFVRFAVKQEGMVDEEPLAVYCASLGSLNMGESQ